MGLPARRTRVAVVGAGPAGLVLANVLVAAGVDCVVVESRSREHVETRARAGFIEQRTVDCLRGLGLAERLSAEAMRHHRCEFRNAGRRFSVPYGDLAGGRSHWVYPQQFLVRDLIEILERRGGEVLFCTEVAAITGTGGGTGDAPVVTFGSGGSGGSGRSGGLACDIVAGCDGFRGVSRNTVPAGSARTFEKRYPYDWLAVLAEATPAPDQIVYALHDDGFAGWMPRTPEISRFYLQCPPGDTAADWLDERIWKELRHRLGDAGRAGPATGRVLEKSVLTMRSAVTEPMQFGRLFLAGDAAHVLTPSGAKGMNLAIADAVALAGALVARFTGGDADGDQLRGYTSARLPDVWGAQEFSDWLLHLVHGPDPAAADPAYQQRLRLARLDQLERSPAFAANFARRYVG